MLTQSGASCMASCWCSERKKIFGRRFWWRHVVQSTSKKRLMCGEVGTQAFREVCGISVSEAVERKSWDFVPDESSDRKPVKGLKEGLNVVSFFGLEDETLPSFLHTNTHTDTTNISGYHHLHRVTHTHTLTHTWMHAQCTHAHTHTCTYTHTHTHAHS